MYFISTTYSISELPYVKSSWYLFVLSISGYFEALGRMQLDGGAADHLNATLLVFYT